MKSAQSSRKGGVAGRLVLAGCAVMVVLFAIVVLFVLKMMDNIATPWRDGAGIYQEFMGTPVPDGVSELSGEAIFWQEHTGQLTFRVDSDETFERITETGFSPVDWSTNRSPIHPEAPNEGGVRLFIRSTEIGEDWTARITLVFDPATRRVWMDADRSYRPGE